MSRTHNLCVSKEDKGHSWVCKLTGKMLAAKSFRAALSWSMVALSVKISVILFAVWAMYSKDFVMIKDDAIQSELSTYLLAIPFLFAYLVFHKRKMLRAVVSFEGHTLAKKSVRTSEIVGFMLCILAFLLYWQGSYTSSPLELHMASFPLFKISQNLSGLLAPPGNRQDIPIIAIKFESTLKFSLFDITKPPFFIFHS